MGACIYSNYCLIFNSFLHACSLIAIHQIRHSILERLTRFAPISDQFSIPSSEQVAALVKTQNPSQLWLISWLLLLNTTFSSKLFRLMKSLHIIDMFSYQNHHRTRHTRSYCFFFSLCSSWIQGRKFLQLVPELDKLFVNHVDSICK
jgi:hypothetical protein